MSGLGKIESKKRELENNLKESPIGLVKSRNDLAGWGSNSILRLAFPGFVWNWLAESVFVGQFGAQVYE